MTVPVFQIVLLKAILLPQNLQLTSTGSITFCVITRFIESSRTTHACVPFRAPSPPGRPSDLRAIGRFHCAAALSLSGICAPVAVGSAFLSCTKSPGEYIPQPPRTHELAWIGTIVQSHHCHLGGSSRRRLFDFRNFTTACCVHRPRMLSPYVLPSPQPSFFLQGTVTRTPVDLEPSLLFVLLHAGPRWTLMAIQQLRTTPPRHSDSPPTGSSSSQVPALTQSI